MNYCRKHNKEYSSYCLTCKMEGTDGSNSSPAPSSQPVTVPDAIKWAMDLCREAAQNTERLISYYDKGRKYKTLAAEARQQAANAKVAIAHLERVLAENKALSNSHEI